MNSIFDIQVICQVGSFEGYIVVMVPFFVCKVVWVYFLCVMGEVINTDQLSTQESISKCVGYQQKFQSQFNWIYSGSGQEPTISTLQVTMVLTVALTVQLRHTTPATLRWEIKSVMKASDNHDHHEHKYKQDVQLLLHNLSNISI